ncbi:TonB-dependent receptor [Phenylobacterium sp.]|uniref:TonB-dependent receptor n=1 Tax=Phenylobacterium sp. TaxID=1871053 RepID=UPI0035AF9167
MDSVVVFGHRAAEREALEQQHKSDNLRSVVTANDAGKLPDQNVGEAVQRMPGVSVDDDQGEGRYVILRGLDPSLTAVRINGQDAAAPEADTREVKVDTIPSGLIGSVEVIKAQTAEYDANAIAGAVDIKTATAFDRRAPFFTGRYSFGHIDLTDSSYYDTDFSGGARFGANDDFGVVVALNASRRPFGSDNLQGSSTWTAVGDQVVPKDWKLRNYDVTRNRQGAAVNFDWRPKDGVKLHLHTLFSHFTDMEQREQFTISLKSQTPTGDGTGTYAGNKVPKRDVKYRYEDEHIATINLGGQFDVGGGVLDADFTTSSAVKDDDPRYNFAFATDSKSDASGTYDLSDVLFKVTPSAAAYDASKYFGSEAELEADHYRETLNQVSANYTLPTTMFAGDTTWKVGLKYTQRHKRSDVFYRLYEVASGSMPLTDFTAVPARTLYGNTFGPTVDFQEALDYARSHNVLTLDAEGSVPDDLGGDYDVKEKVAAGYVQATIHVDRWTVIPGLRVEHTKSDYAGKQFDETASFDTPFNVFGSKSYTDYFPSIVGRYDFNENTLVRLAVTTAIGRPNYEDLAPTVNYSRNDGEISLGNPELKPLKSVNFDIGVEHYFGRSGVISISLFRKNIDNPVFQTERDPASETINGVTYTGVKIFQPVNLSSAYAEGAEFNFVMQLDNYLPSPFDGMGVSFNATAQKSHTDADGRSVPLIYTSDLTGTAELTYEKYNWTARLAYSYRSKFLDTLGDSDATDTYTAGRGRLDFKVGYAINKNWQVYAEGKNLTDADWRRWIGNSRQLVENERYGSTYAIGVAAKF